MSNFKTLDLAIEFHELVEKYSPKGHLRDQLFRAAASIPLNLAEGNSKASVKEKKRFSQTAYGSLQECKVALRMAKCDDVKLVDTADKLGAWIYNLLKSEIKVQKF